MGKIALPAFAAVLLTTSAAWAADDEAQRERAALSDQPFALIDVFNATRQAHLGDTLDIGHGEAVTVTSSGMKS